MLKAPRIEYCNAIAHEQRLILIVRYKNCREAVGFEDVANFRAHLLPQARIQIGEWLVQQQHSRVRRQRPCKRHALLLPAGELMRHASAHTA